MISEWVRLMLVVSMTGLSEDLLHEGYFQYTAWSDDSKWPWSWKWRAIQVNVVIQEIVLIFYGFLQCLPSRQVTCKLKDQIEPLSVLKISQTTWDNIFYARLGKFYSVPRQIKVTCYFKWGTRFNPWRFQHHPVFCSFNWPMGLWSIRTFPISPPLQSKQIHAWSWP